MSLFCHRNNHPVRYIAACTICRGRRGCETYQLYLQPELPLNFPLAEGIEGILKTEDHVKLALDALPANEYRRLFLKALSLLPPDARKKRILIRIKIYELLCSQRQSQRQGEGDA